MYTSYNISQNRINYPRNFHRGPNFNPNMTHINRPSNPAFNDGDRFFGGGFLGPFLLGGVGGYLLGRPNYNYNGPIPVFFPNGAPYQPYPVPYYTNNYYY